MTRTEDRRQHRERLKRAEALLRLGFPLAPSEADVIDMAALFKQALAPASGQSRARAAARLSHRLNEAAARRAPAERTLACKTGCAYCCRSNRVAVTAPEVFLILATLEATASGKGKPRLSDLSARCHAIARLDNKARVEQKPACSLLEANLCSVYDVRPATCRQTTAFDLAPCLDEFEGRAPDQPIAGSRNLWLHTGHSQLMLMVGLKANRFPTRRYELNAALARALETPNSEARWLEGADIFEDLPPIGEDAGLERAVNGITAALARTAN